MPYFSFDSKNVFYREKGEGDLLIILPGNTASSAAHAPQVELYSQFYHTVSPDFLGTGQSDRIDEWSTDWWQQGAEQVHTLINHLGKSSPILMGTSGGAIVALHAMDRYPGEVKALILDSFSLQFTDNMLRSNVLNGRENPDEMQIQFWQYCHGDDWEQVVNADTAMMIALAEQGGQWLPEPLPALSSPVLLTGSLKDEFLPDLTQDFAKIQENAETCKIFLADSGGHPLMFTRPDPFNQQVMNFLNKSL